MSPKIIFGSKDSMNSKCPDLLHHSDELPLLLTGVFPLPGTWGCWEGLIEEKELEQEQLPVQGF